MFFPRNNVPQNVQRNSIPIVSDKVTLNLIFSNNTPFKDPALVTLQNRMANIQEKSGKM